MIACALLQRCWLWSCVRTNRAYHRALDDPMAAQYRLLARYLKQNADTQFGRKHRFKSIYNLDKFQRRVPLSTYDDYAHWIDRIRAGKEDVLTRDPVTRLVPSSGSTAACKLIPYNQTLLREFQAGIAPWITALFRSWPDARNGPAYWSVSPAFSFDDGKPSAVSLGFDDDSAYLSPFARRLVSRTLAVPSAVRHIADIDTLRYVTLLHLLHARRLGIISVWHPSFLTLMLDALPRWWSRLIDDIAKGTVNPPGDLPAELAASFSKMLKPSPKRAAELRGIEPRSRRWIEAIWPKLQVVSCWADGAAQGAAEDLAAKLEGIALQPKGLVSTEAMITLPIGSRHPLAVNSHFFEFLNDDSRHVPMDALQVGGEYTLAVTTGGGLYRYRLGDRVRVTGWLKRTPTLRFLGKEDRLCDIAGEKLSEGFIASVLKQLFAGFTTLPTFAMLAPDPHPDSVPGYTLYIESSAALSPGTAAQLEELLSENPHYQHCVNLGQIRPVRCFVVEHDAHEVFMQRMIELGKPLGQIKPTALSNEAGWGARFSGRYLSVG